MSARLRGIAHHNEEIVAAGGYRLPDGREVRLREAVAASCAATRLYGPDPVDAHPGTGRATAFAVTGESSTAAARRLAARGGEPPAVLSFASARNPGGGYLNGAQAQEEALCRASALHTTLLRARDYYEHHRADRSPLYSDRVIHSPGIPVFRDDRGALLTEPFAAGFLTSPAPNAGVVRSRAPEQLPLIPGILRRRAERVLQTAVAAGYRRLVLGAWGCGVFANDPAQVASAFRTHLAPGARFGGHFDEVVFAVLDRTPGQRTLGAFRSVLGGLPGAAGGEAAGGADSAGRGAQDQP
ncbi:TIGR02452 family protein [Streptomyces sp. NPDC047999]|uniref:TIGR02452 family protein n=1 Tax=Streptomyces sp. NPDC047999 TaxID=3365497 RepID=UPI0037170332